MSALQLSTRFSVEAKVPKPNLTWSLYGAMPKSTPYSENAVSQSNAAL
jgi:hypothetical protein